MYPCPLGTNELLGNGFDGGGNGFKGATGWLTTTVPVAPGSNISLRFGVYDSGDSISDSTVLLDNWQWITTPGVAYSTAVAK
jgi:hypothetical protein